MIAVWLLLGSFIARILPTIFTLRDEYGRVVGIVSSAPVVFLGYLIWRQTDRYFEQRRDASSTNGGSSEESPEEALDPTIWSSEPWRLPLETSGTAATPLPELSPHSRVDESPSNRPAA